MIVIGTSVLLLLVSMYLVLGSSKRLHKRLGLSLASVASAGILATVFLAEGWPVSRKIILIANQPLTEKGVAIVKTHIPPGSEIASLLVSDGSVLAQPTFHGFTALQDICDSRQSGDCRPSMVITPHPGNWLYESVHTAISLLRRSLWDSLTLKKATIIVWFDRGRPFGSDRMTEEWSHLDHDLISSDIDLFLMENRDAAPVKLDVSLQRTIIPESFLPDLNDRFWVDLPMSARKAFLNGRLELSADIDSDITSASLRTLPSNPQFPIEVPLAGKKAQTLFAGHHRLQVKLSSVQSDKSVLKAEGATYFRAEKKTLILISQNPGELKARVDSAVKRLMKQPKRIESLWYRLAGDTIKSLSFEQALAAGDIAFGNSRTLWVVKPAPSQWAQLLTQLHLRARIQNGLNVFVVEPPTEGVPVLPTKTLTIHGDPVRVHFDRRLYFLRDTSRPARLPPISQTASSGAARMQDDVVNGVLAQLGYAGTSESLRQNSRSVLCDGKATLDDSDCSDEGVRVYPSLSVAADDAEIRANYASGNSASWRKALVAELAPSSLNIRLGQLMLEGPKRGFLNDTDFYPNTVLVSFDCDIPQVAVDDPDLPPRLTVQGFQSDDMPNVFQHHSSTSKDLAGRGISRIIVSMPLEADYEKYYKAADPNFTTLRASIDTNSHGDSLPVTVAGVKPGVGLIADLRQESIDGVVKKIVALVGAQARNEQVVVDRPARLVDERIPSNARLAPLQQLVFAPAESLPFDFPAALVSDAARSSRITKLPLIVSRGLGEGLLATFAFDPFDEHIWLQNDRAMRPGGWGFQRLIDSLDRSASFQPSTSTPVVAQIEELTDGSTLLLHCWMALSADRPIPTAKLAGQEMDVVAIDPLSNRITYQLSLRDSRELNGPYDLLFAGMPAIPVFLHLKGTPLPGRTTAEILSKIADFSGGSTLSGVPAVSRRQLASGRSSTWITGMFVALLLALTFSPVVRPWYGVTYWSVFLRRRFQFAQGLVAPNLAPLDVESTLTEWGTNPGSPTAKRIAGTPGPAKIYEIGDSISMARRVTLLSFTKLGRDMHLPLQRPVLRQRHSTRALRAHVYVDTNRSLAIPLYSESVPKTQFAASLSFFLAQTILRRAGIVYIRAFPPGLDSVELLSNTPLDEIRTTIAAYPSSVPGEPLRLSSQTQPGDVVFIVSDLLAPYWDSLEEFARSLIEDGIDLRIAHIFDTFEYKSTGLVWDVSSSTIQDRSTWDTEDVANRLKSYADGRRGVIQQIGGLFVSVPTDVPSEQLLDILNEGQFLK
jgi:hypothetical protein